MAIRYANGAVPTTVIRGQIGSGNMGASNQPVPASELAINESGTWDCGTAGGDGTTYAPQSFQPGQTVSYESWLVVPQAIDNAHPKLSQAVLGKVGPPPVDERGGRPDDNGMRSLAQA